MKPGTEWSKMELLCRLSSSWSTSSLAGDNDDEDNRDDNGDDNGDDNDK